MIKNSVSYESPKCEVVEIVSQGIMSGSGEYGYRGTPGPDADKDDLGDF